MTQRLQILIGLTIILVVVGIGCALLFLRPFGGSQPVVAPPAPAAVAKPFKEDQVNSITLSSEAVARLALRTAPVERKAMPRKRVYGGEVTIPPGLGVIVSAPLGGITQAPASGMPRPGQKVERGQAIVQLLPLLSPEGRVNMATARIEADGQVKSAQTQSDAAGVTLDRARRVFQSEAGSKRAVDDAQAQFDLATKALEGATARRDLLQKAVGEVEKGTAAALTIESPQPGLLRNVSVLPGQNVPAGAALFEVVNLDHAWVRVPVYVGDLPSINVAREADVGNLTATHEAESGEQRGESQNRGISGSRHSALNSRLTVQPATAPPAANLAAGTVDLIYELDNREVRYRPGQRVGVTLSLKGEEKVLTVPWSAVVFDIHGGAWVYEQTGDRAYVRRRVVLRHVMNGTAVLDSGPNPGTQVVTTGTYELFGTETGFSK